MLTRHTLIKLTMVLFLVGAAFNIASAIEVMQEEQSERIEALEARLFDVELQLSGHEYRLSQKETVKSAASPKKKESKDELPA